MLQLTTRSGWTWGTALLVVATTALAIGPAHARGKAKGHQDGGIDPTSVPLLGSDSQVSASFAPEDSYALQQPIRDQIRADEAHQHATGAGIVVAVLDSGFDTSHPAIAGNVSPFGYDTLDGDADPNDFGDGIDNDGDGVVDLGVGHGTFVAGMVLLAAPDATILPIRVRNDEGRSPDAAVADGIEYALEMGADVINISLSQAPTPSSPINGRAAQARNAGVHVIVSAGNQGLPEAETLESKRTLAAGAVDGDDVLAEFSNYDAGNTYGDVVYAPGVELFGPTVDGRWDFWSGTSFSAGLVSGAVALRLEVSPGLDPNRMASQILRSSDRLPSGMRQMKLRRINLYELVR